MLSASCLVESIKPYISARCADSDSGAINLLRNNQPSGVGSTEFPLFMGNVLQERLTLALFPLRSSLFFPIALSTIVCFALVGVGSGVAQTGGAKPSKKKSIISTDVSLGVFGQLTRTRPPGNTVQDQYGSYSTQTTQGTSPSAGVLGTFHQSLHPWLGYNINLGYSRFSENYSQGAAYVPAKNSPVPAWYSFSRGSIGTEMYELSIAYVFEGPRTRRFNTFGQFGGGGLFFLPTQNPSPANKQIRPAMVFGVGMNYRILRHFDVRAEYRGLFYKNPDFAYSIGGIPITKMFTVTSTPTVSLVYRFGEGRKNLRYAAKSH